MFWRSGLEGILTVAILFLLPSRQPLRFTVDKLITIFFMVNKMVEQFQKRFCLSARLCVCLVVVTIVHKRTSWDD